jgi:hypothetical protein
VTGAVAITVDNAASPLPFGTIDTPTQGGTAESSAFVNLGWALTPQPNIIPTNGSTITVYIDSVPKGHPVYNNYRVDIATIFPGYQNSAGAVGYFTFDTTAYENGLHTIAWSVTDSAGNTTGIGSRYWQTASVKFNTEVRSNVASSVQILPIVLFNDDSTAVFGTLYCYGGLDCTTLSCNISTNFNNEITATTVDSSTAATNVAFTANTSTPAGSGLVTCGYFNISAPPASLTVWDATPTITSISHYYGGNPIFSPGEGLVAVRILGTNLGDCGTLSVGPSGAGVSADTSRSGPCGSQYVTNWTPTEIDAHFDVASTTPPGSYTVTVTETSDDDGMSFQSSGQPQSQTSGSGAMQVSCGHHKLARMGCW